MITKPPSSTSTSRPLIAAPPQPPPPPPSSPRSPTSTEGDNLDSEEPPASYIVKFTAGNSTHFDDFEVEINSKFIDA